jgi:hypothetical protein
MPPGENIRVDMMIILPALFFNFVLWAFIIIHAIFFDTPEK